MRTSNQKIIINQRLFDDLYPEYLLIIERLAGRYPATIDESYEKLVNFRENKGVPRHQWYDYKHGFAEQLITDIIRRENPDRESYVLDPFCGVGTTNLAAQALGYRSIGFDINPMAILAAEAKTHKYSDEEVEEIETRIRNFALPQNFEDIDGGKAFRTAFTPEVMTELLRIKAYVDGIAGTYVGKLFRLAMISVIDECSLKVKDGNGLKFKKNYKPLPSVSACFLAKVESMLEDIRRMNLEPEAECIFGSMLDPATFGMVGGRNIGLCIFSPPYANCFDYCEVYKLELWIGGFVKYYEDFERYRSLAMRSHVNSKFDHHVKNENSDVDTIAEIVSAFNIWNKNIPDMLRGYFDDMHVLLGNLREILEDNAKCYIVVANSGYKGILVPTDLLIADIASRLGYKVNNITFARKIRSSSQQMRILNEGYDNLMRESIIELQKQP